MKKIKRSIAEKKKLEKYFTGSTCIRGHRAERYTFGIMARRGKCVVCWEEDHKPEIEPEEEVERRPDLGIMGNYF